MIKYAVLGPRGSNGHAVLNQFKIPDEIILFAESNKEVMEKVAGGEAFFGFVPIENSTGGLVAEVLEIWLSRLFCAGETDLFVTGEIYQEVKHHLLVKSNICHMEEIKRVISHPQALRHCSVFLDNHRIKERIPSMSTSAAAERVAFGVDDNIAAIASSFAGDTYGLKVLRANIQNFHNNTTRFHILHGSLMNYQEKARSKGYDKIDSGKTIIMFSPPDEPGSLKRVLDVLHGAGVNISSIHSVPLGAAIGKYAFYIEFNNHQWNARVEPALRIIKILVTKYLLVGSFIS